MVWFIVTARSLYFVREHAIHVWYDFYWQYLRGARRSLTIDDKAKALWGILTKDSLEYVV